MPRVDVHMSSTIPPERIRKALIDFSPDRPKTWPGITPSLYEVYETGDSWAEVREGTKMAGSSVWAREHYDWSDPDTVRWTVKESNFCAPGSYVQTTVRSEGSGGSTIDLIWDRKAHHSLGSIDDRTHRGNARFAGHPIDEGRACQPRSRIAARFRPGSGPRSLASPRRR